MYIIFGYFSNTMLYFCQLIQFIPDKRKFGPNESWRNWDLGYRNKLIGKELVRKRGGFQQLIPLAAPDSKDLRSSLGHRSFEKLRPYIILNKLNLGKLILF